MSAYVKAESREEATKRLKGPWEDSPSTVLNSMTTMELMLLCSLNLGSASEDDLLSRFCFLEDQDELRVQYDLDNTITREHILDALYVLTQRAYIERAYNGTEVYIRYKVTDAGRLYARRFAAMTVYVVNKETKV